MGAAVCVPACLCVGACVAQKGKDSGCWTGGWWVLGVRNWAYSARLRRGVVLYRRRSGAQGWWMQRRGFAWHPQQLMAYEAMCERSMPLHPPFVCLG